MKLLIVDDDEGIVKSLTAFLSQEGYHVRSAQSIQEAKTTLDGSIDLVILDWSLPDGQGIQLLREWRQKGVSLPVIMLTARAELVDKVLGLELGADDYITKPFEPRELLARVSARLRSKPEHQITQATLRYANVELHISSRRAMRDGESVELTKLEFELLRLFFENPNQAFSRDELLNRVWGFENFPTTRTVDTHILQLRQKFPKLEIETIRGIGYRLDKK